MNGAVEVSAKSANYAGLKNWKWEKEHRITILTATGQKIHSEPISEMKDIWIRIRKDGTCQNLKKQHFKLLDKFLGQGTKTANHGLCCANDCGKITAKLKFQEPMTCNNSECKRKTNFIWWCSEERLSHYFCDACDQKDIEVREKIIIESQQRRSKTQSSEEKPKVEVNFD